MKTISYVVSASVLLLTLSGCQLIQKNTAPVENNTVSSKPEAIIELPPKMVSTDWRVILSPLVNELLQTTEPSEQNLLLVSDTKNNTGEYVALNRVNNTLQSLLTGQDLFVVINKNMVNQGKHILGIPFDDTSVSRSKVTGLARYLKADYVLFTAINTLPKSPDTEANVSMELISTKSGEIIWHFSSDEINSVATTSSANEPSQEAVVTSENSGI